MNILIEFSKTELNKFQGSFRKVRRIKSLTDVISYKASLKNGSFFTIFEIWAEVAILSHILTLKRVKKEMFNRHQFFPTNKQYLKIKLMQNETNRWSSFLVKTKYW